MNIEMSVGFKPILWTVLRSGGEYGPEHVIAVRKNLSKVYPGAILGVISDQTHKWPGEFGQIFEARPPQPHWPGWWMKMWMFSQELPFASDGLFYCDLDTVFVGPLADILLAEGDIVLRDFFRGGAMDGKPRAGFAKPSGHDIGSGFMRWSHGTRLAIWAEWKRDPEFWMNEAGAHGDQRAIMFILDRLRCRPSYWQDVMPGKIVSYKADIKMVGRQDPPPTASVVCFHGQPRPWAVQDKWVIDART